MAIATAPAAPAAPAPAQLGGALTLENVSQVFVTAKGPYVALRDVNLTIQRGEFISLIGHSGCGKSTLLNMIAGLLPQTTGTITLDGRPITGPGPDRGVVFQNYSLLPWLSVHGNVYEVVHAVHRDKSRQEQHALVDEFLGLVGLSSHRDKKPHQISGGMKQRVALARAFAIHPKVLLLDEPFGALDALTKATLHQELMNMWGVDNKTETVIMVTHDVNEALILSDRVVVMTNGPEATIGEIVDVPIPRPRDPRHVIHTSEWIETKDHLLYLLTEKYQRAL
jgi:nitrate ABC transporter ATP-binding subunit